MIVKPFRSHWKTVLLAAWAGVALILGTATSAWAQQKSSPDPDIFASASTKKQKNTPVIMEQPTGGLNLPPASLPEKAPATLPEIQAATQELLGGNEPVQEEIYDENVVPASCASCGGGGLLGKGIFGYGPYGDDDVFGCPSVNCGKNCYAGRTHCCSEGCCDSYVGRCLASFYHCICCPDPCYEPRWIAGANSAFFTKGARPVTQTRLRYEGLFNITKPDRGEYYVARFNTSPGQAGVANPMGQGPAGAAASADINEFNLYTEVAAAGFSFYISMPYRSIEFDPAANGQAVPEFEAGFGDLWLGTKSLLLDCELLKATFAFTTYTPTGLSGKGLGVGHVSLEPALLFSVKLTPQMYFQWETAYWFGIGGDDDFRGNVWRNHWSFNRYLWYIHRDVQLIGSLEMATYSILDGAYTDPTDAVLVNGQITPLARNAHDLFFSMGPGLRLNICDKIDFGVGSLFSLTDTHFADQAVRVEFRWRF